MEKPEKHKLTPSDHAKAIQSDGIPNLGGILEEIGKQKHEKAMAQIILDKKLLGVVMVLAVEVEELKRQMAEIGRKV